MSSGGGAPVTIGSLFWAAGCWLVSEGRQIEERSSCDGKVGMGKGGLPG